MDYLDRMYLNLLIEGLDKDITEQKNLIKFYESEKNDEMISKHKEILDYFEEKKKLHLKELENDSFGGYY